MTLSPLPPSTALADYLSQVHNLLFRIRNASPDMDKDERLARVKHVADLMLKALPTGVEISEKAVQRLHLYTLWLAKTAFSCPALGGSGKHNLKLKIGRAHV